MTPAPLTLIVASPRGFCAGVDRAIQIVERALERFGAPVYVRHEIVHNAHVVAALTRQGAIFVDTLDDVPEGRPVIFSAHGVAKAVVTEAESRRMLSIDATCPLVSKVHREAEHHFAAGRFILLIGHRGHPEVEGTLGQLPPGAIVLVESAEDAASIAVPDWPLAVITQTTLSVDETASILDVLRQRFPNLHEPKHSDICYATTNRQHAVQAIAAQVARMVILGSPNSSNAQRLVEVARTYGCLESRLVSDVSAMDWAWLADATTLGLSAGASTPEHLVQEMIAACRARYDLTVHEHTVAEETLKFNLPKSVA